jgi:hypothetical protein
MAEGSCIQSYKLVAAVAAAAAVVARVSHVLYILDASCGSLHHLCCGCAYDWNALLLHFLYVIHCCIAVHNMAFTLVTSLCCVQVSATIHLANRNWAALVDDFIDLEFLPADANRCVL